MCHLITLLLIITVTNVLSNHDKGIDRPPVLSVPSSRYPIYQPLLDAVTNWPPDDPEIPPNFVETIQIFNYSDPYERNIAEGFRNAEVPFKLIDVHDVNSVVKKWSDDYLLEVLKDDIAVNTITSKNNHFMFWRKSKERSSNLDSSHRPVGHSDMSFKQWLSLAKNADTKKLSADVPHFYFRKNDPANKKGALFPRRMTYLIISFRIYVCRKGPPIFFN